MAAGVKTGGRRKGTPNKATAARAAAAEAPSGLPLTHAREREAAVSRGKPMKTGPDDAPAPQAIPASLDMKGKPAPPQAIQGIAGDGALPSNPSLPPFRWVPIDKLTPYENNARVHSPAQIDMLAKMIARFGWTNPVLVDGRKGIIAGHGRVLAARKLGMDAVPTIELSHMSKAERRAYVIADNKSALSAGWDDELLRLELGELRDDGFDLELTGFDDAEIDALFNEPDLPEPASEPESGNATTITCPNCGHEFAG